MRLDAMGYECRDIIVLAWLSVLKSYLPTHPSTNTQACINLITLRFAKNVWVRL